MPFHKRTYKSWYTYTYIVQNSQIKWDSNYIYINIFIERFKIINSLKMCSLQGDVLNFSFGGCECT